MSLTTCATTSISGTETLKSRFHLLVPGNILIDIDENELIIGWLVLILLA